MSLLLKMRRRPSWKRLIEVSLLMIMLACVSTPFVPVLFVIDLLFVPSIWCHLKAKLSRYLLISSSQRLSCVNSHLPRY